MKTPQIMDALRNWRAPNSFHLTFIHLNTISSDYIPQENDLMGEKGILLKVTIEFLSFQNLNDLPKMVQVLFFYLAVYENIIKVEN